MAALVGRVSFGAGASLPLAVNTAKTAVVGSAPANQRVKIKAFGFWFDGQLSTAMPVQIIWSRASAAGTSTAATPQPSEEELTETFQSTWGINCTVEPTYTHQLDCFTVHPQNGYEYLAPLGDEEIIKGGGIMGWQALSMTIVNLRGYIKIEE